MRSKMVTFRPHPVKVCRKRAKRKRERIQTARGGESLQQSRGGKGRRGEGRRQTMSCSEGDPVPGYPPCSLPYFIVVHFHQSQSTSGLQSGAATCSEGCVTCFLEFPRPLGCTAAAMLPKQAWATFRKHITKPSEQVAAPDCIHPCPPLTSSPYLKVD